jgi:hypothetical protein
MDGIIGNDLEQCNARHEKCEEQELLTING